MCFLKKLKIKSRYVFNKINCNRFNKKKKVSADILPPDKTDGQKVLSLHSHKYSNSWIISGKIHYIIHKLFNRTPNLFEIRIFHAAAWQTYNILC